MAEGDLAAVPCCWVCEEIVADDTSSEEPFVLRDDCCSCSGTDRSSGSSCYAHIKCLVQRAERELKQALEREDWDNLHRAFEVCPKCNEKYQKETKYDLATALVKFLEKEYMDFEYVGFAHQCVVVETEFAGCKE